MTEQFVKISVDMYADMLEARFCEAQNLWGSEKTKALWGDVKDLILENAPYMDPDNTNPSYIVDNYVVNSEIVSREDWENDDYYITGKEKYEDFDDYADNVGYVRNGDYVLINFGF